MGFFGVYEDPYSLPTWQDTTGIRADLSAMFEPWSNQRALTTQLAEAKALGHDSFMVTWEPWDPATRTAYPMDAIAAGRYDDYIDLFARALRDSGLTIYLRFAHEMNGTWYPWAHDPVAFRDAWMHVRDRVRFARKATNVRFVWAPNADLWADNTRFLTRALQYWPPARYVDDIGLTIIERDTTGYTMDVIAHRLDLVEMVFDRSTVLAAEVSCVLGEAADWFGRLADLVSRHSVAGMVLNQSGSEDTGLNWSIEDHPMERDAVARLVAAVRGG